MPTDFTLVYDGVFSARQARYDEKSAARITVTFT